MKKITRFTLTLTIGLSMLSLTNCNNTGSSSNGFSSTQTTGDPRKDGENCAKATFDCELKHMDEVSPVIKKIVTNFENYHFKNKKEVFDKIKELHVGTTPPCDEIYEKMRKEYLTDIELSGKFDYAYKTMYKEYEHEIRKKEEMMREVYILFDSKYELLPD